MASSNTVRMGPPRPEPSSDGTYMPESTPPDDFWPEDFGSMAAIRTSEVRFLEDHNTPERIALEQRILKKLQQITQQPLHQGFAARRARTDQYKTIQLTPEQARVHHMVVREGSSIFFTGAAGTGKSILLRRIIDDLRIKYNNWIAVTASTGIAACAVGGRTVHSWAGIGLGSGDGKTLVKSVRRSPAATTRWKNTKCLIIDEVSMLSPELLDNLDFVAQKIRKSKLPFGGMQVVLTGDFFQLPPVDKNSKERQYAFDAKCWNEIVTRTILLTQVFRQTDTTFQQMLTEARYGKISDETAKLFASLNRDPPSMPKDITPTRLFSRRYEVEKANNESLRRLDEEPLVFHARDHVYPPPEENDENRQNHHRAQVDPQRITWMAPTTVTLKKGAQVMMIKNIDETLVNGSIGRILAWVEAPPMPPSLTDNKKVIDVTAIANEIHSCNYSKLMRFDRSLSSECRDPVKGEQSVNPSDHLLPLVRFFNRDGTFRDVILQKETWNYENEYGDVLVSRTQLPLILAYALSIHKAQGQTLDYVHVDMRSVFEVGQAYVALSRATHLEGLKLVGFNPSRVKCDPRVAGFYDGLERVIQPSVRDLFGANNNTLEKRPQDELEVNQTSQLEEEEEEESQGHRDYRELFAEFAHKRHAPDYDNSDHPLELKREAGNSSNHRVEPKIEPGVVTATDEKFKAPETRSKPLVTPLDLPVGLKDQAGEDALFIPRDVPHEALNESSDEPIVVPAPVLQSAFEDLSEDVIEIPAPTMKQKMEQWDFSDDDEPLEVPEAVLRSAMEQQELLDKELASKTASAPPRYDSKPANKLPPRTVRSSTGSEFVSLDSSPDRNPLNSNAMNSDSKKVADLGPVPDIYLPPPPQDNSNDLFVTTEAFDCTIPVFLDSESEDDS